MLPKWVEDSRVRRWPRQYWDPVPARQQHSTAAGVISRPYLEAARQPNSGSNLVFIGREPWPLTFFRGKNSETAARPTTCTTGGCGVCYCRSLISTSPERVNTCSTSWMRQASILVQRWERGECPIGGAMCTLDAPRGGGGAVRLRFGNHHRLVYGRHQAHSTK